MNHIFDDIQAKINEALEKSPAKDLEKNVKALMTQGFAKLDLVTREEFDIQAQILAKTREKLHALEARVAALEARNKEE
jgi:ubiquinone biosynthesis accessory factor UbiK